ncbi:hypothetical protein B566_EDAN001113 [Ephemera danica]|nr:hypothetical protein B566_EDAN001113 [Ephemera danica]
MARIPSTLIILSIFSRAIFQIAAVQSATNESPQLEMVAASQNSQEDVPLICNLVNATEYRNRLSQLNTFFLNYYREPVTNEQTCDYNNPPSTGKVCKTGVKNWNTCNRANSYMHHGAIPCNFLKLSNVIGWIPEFYNNTNDLPSNMPSDLKKYINSESKRGTSYLNNIWVSCKGKSPADQENVEDIAIFPSPSGFPGYFYSNLNVEGYLSPLVAVTFEHFMTNIIIGVECKAWAKNINESQAVVNFEFLVENRRH